MNQRPISPRAQSKVKTCVTQFLGEQSKHSNTNTSAVPLVGDPD